MADEEYGLSTPERVEEEVTFDEHDPFDDLSFPIIPKAESTFESKPQISVKHEPTAYEYNSFHQQGPSSFDSSGYGSSSSSSFNTSSSSYFELFRRSEGYSLWENKENYSLSMNAAFSESPQHQSAFSQPKSSFSWNNYAQTYLNHTYFAEPSSPSFYPSGFNNLLVQQSEAKENFDSVSKSSSKRPFICSFANCGKSYTKSGHLIAHERCHMAGFLHDEAQREARFKTVGLSVCLSSSRVKVINCFPTLIITANNCLVADSVRTFVCDELVPLTTPTSGNSHVISQRLSPPPAGYKYCGVAFLRCDQLTRHRREHLMVKPFKCPYCDRNFNRSDHRLVHVRRHAPEERLQPAAEKELLQANTFLPKRKRPRKPLAHAQQCSPSNWI
ncbi:hypothetical protein Ciccas_001097 [Cichlidogyrus casuarinus]|uniref:C2H2-type domain-containing protein n=1 Tax=Cichlidogyrus casuarinus TaxID=1844966 RepID=A0ABD2QNZ5_9PLAT